MKKEKIGFCILHYLVKDVTINCVNSIMEKCKGENYAIVIVDNASNNNSGKELQKLYKNNNKVKVIINKTNLGFAKGNNVGFRYLKKLGCDYIVMLNNDTLLLTNHFGEEIIKEWKKSKFDVMGPEIIDINNRVYLYGSPIWTKKHFKKAIQMDKILILLSHLHLLRLLVKLKDKKENHQEVKEAKMKYQKDAFLHGCCFIFSKNYIDKFDGLDDRTFLYGEEALLYLRLKKNKMLSVYNPKIKIKHLEDVSTDYEIPNFNKKRIKAYKNHIKSNKIILEELKKIEESEINM